MANIKHTDENWNTDSMDIDGAGFISPEDSGVDVSYTDIPSHTKSHSALLTTKSHSVPLSTQNDSSTLNAKSHSAPLSRKSHSAPLNTIHESTTDSGVDSIISSEYGGTVVSRFPMTHGQSRGQLSEKMLPLKKRKLQQHLLSQNDQSAKEPSIASHSPMQIDRQFSSFPLDFSSTGQMRRTPSPAGPLLATTIKTQPSHEHSFTPVTQNDMLRVVNGFAALNTRSPQRPEQYDDLNDVVRQASPMNVCSSEFSGTPKGVDDTMTTGINIAGVVGPPGYSWHDCSAIPAIYSNGTSLYRHVAVKDSGASQPHVQQTANQYSQQRNQHTGAKGTNSPSNSKPERRYTSRSVQNTDTNIPSTQRKTPSVDGNTASPDRNTAITDRNTAITDRNTPNIDRNSPSINESPESTDITQEDCRMVAEPDEDGDLPLHIAVVQEEPFAVDRVIDIMNRIKFPLDYSNRLKQTALHLATITKQPAILKKLLLAGASPNLPDRKGHSCCHLAVNYHSPACLCTIFNCSSVKIDIDAKNFEGLTALHRAVQLGYMDCTNILLERGAQIDIADGKSGKTPLYLAFECNQPGVADLLIARGADVNIPTYSGSTVLQAANSKGQHLLNSLMRGEGEITNSSVRELQSKLSAKAQRSRPRLNQSLPLTASNSNKRPLPVSPVNSAPLSTQNFNNQQSRYETM